MKKLLVAIVFVAQASSPAYAQTAVKRPITHDVYDSWKSIQGTKLSADGVKRSWTRSQNAADEFRSAGVEVVSCSRKALTETLREATNANGHSD